MRSFRARYPHVLVLVLFVLSLFGATGATPVPLSESSENSVTLHFFYSPTCPHCHAQSEWMDDWVLRDDQLTIIRYNISDPEVYAFLETVAAVFDESQVAVPFTVVGGKYYVGYNDNVRVRIEQTVNRYHLNDYVDIMAKILNDEPIVATDFDTTSDQIFVLPILGEVDVQQVSLLLIGAVIGLVDGFNPCAMWVLLFLIALLLGSKDRKKMWTLGIAFLLTSAAVYFAIMLSWIETVRLLGANALLQTIIGILAIGAGLWSFYRYNQQRKKDTGCEITTEPRRKQIMQRLRTLVQEKPLLLAIPGIMFLAVSVNLLELACSAGLPILYSEILIVNQVGASASIGYLLWYVLFFLLDDLLIFTGAMVTMRLTAFSNRYVRYTHLVGGAIMVFIGLALLFFPQLIMFGW